MEVLRHLTDVQSSRGTVVTVGNFDGVHVGHQGVLGRAVERARELGCMSAALTFVPHPVRILAPGREPARLTPLERKLSLMAKCGVDMAIVLPFDRRLSTMEAQAFAREVLFHGIGAKVIIVGEDFRFGLNRAGDIALLRDLGPELGFAVEPFQPVMVEDRPVSSTRIRGDLLEGRVELAARLLGRPHDVSGIIVMGDQRGRELGFPTANFGGLRAMLPGKGVFACWAVFGGARRMAAVNIGDRPTFDRGRSVEAFLLDFEGDLYGREMALEFVARLRSDERFPSVNALVEQIGKDVEQTREILSRDESA